MAGKAIRHCIGEIPADMAAGAIESGVRAHERKTCKPGVVKPRALPAVHVVTGFTREW